MNLFAPGSYYMWHPYSYRVVKGYAGVGRGETDEGGGNREVEGESQKVL